MESLEVFIAHLDSIYYEGYAQQLAQENPQAFKFELDQFLNNYNFRSMKPNQTENQNQHKDIYQKVTNIILQLLESAERGQWQKQWVVTGAGIPTNAFSKNRYRGINFFLLSIIAMFQKYNLNRWLSLKQANELGGRIRKGEKSSPVVLYKRTYFDKNGRKYNEEQVQEMSKEEFARLEMKSKTMLAEYHVFNVAQIEGLPSEYYLAPNAKNFTEFEKDNEAEELLKLSGAVIHYGGDVAYYSPSSDEICLPSREQFKGTEPFYSVAFHELAHWTGAECRLNRKPKSEDSKKDYALEELVAELATAFICSSVGFESQITNNVAYLRSWIGALKEDNKIILRIASDAQKAADFVLQPMQEAVRQVA